MIDLHTGTQKYIPLLETGNGQIVSTEISTIFQDRQGGLWLGTFNRGLLYHHPSMHKLTHIGRNAFPVSPEEEINIESFAEDKDGNIYLKAHSRIYRLTANEQKSYVLKSAAIPSVSPEILNRLNPNKNHHSEIKYTIHYIPTHADGHGQELLTDWNFLPAKTTLPHISSIVKTD